MSRVFRFPNPVNEVAARTVAAGVALMTAGILGAGWTWLIAPLAYGFVARVAAGPTFSPLGQLATRVVPLLPFEPRAVPGPPKRFAQAIGATLSVSAAVAHFAFGATTVALVLVALIAIAATVEAVRGFCLGCAMFGALMRAGMVPEEVCLVCADLSQRQPKPV